MLTLTQTDMATNILLETSKAQEIRHLSLRDAMERNEYTLNILTLLDIIRKALK